MTDSGEREVLMSVPKDVPIRHSAPPQSSRTLEGSTLPSLASSVQDAPRPTSSDVWAGAISRLQTQVSLNTSLLESHRQKVHDLETAMTRLQYEMINVSTTLRDIQSEIRSKPITAAEGRHDPGDLEVLAGQMEAVSTKANEVDGLKMQLELVKNRMKRWEEQGSPAVSAPRPGTSSTHRESSFHEVQPPLPPTMLQQQPRPVYHQPLPPIRTSSMSSPVEGSPAGLHLAQAATHVPMLDAQAGPSYRGASEARPYSMESPAGRLRPSDALPPPSSLSGWRPADAVSHPGGLPPPPLPPGAVRHPAVELEPQGTGWAAVNAAQTVKRPFEEQHQSPYESPVTGSPKRPKLAPIMPRSSYGDEASYVPSSIVQSGTSELPFLSRSRAPSNGSQSQSQILQAPSSANMPGRRFIISTAQADSQDSWRPESERMMHFQGHQGHGHGRGRGRGGRNRGGRRGRGGGVYLPPEPQELGTPEWEKPGWTGSQVSENGFYHPLHHQHHSPKEGRGGIVRSSGGFAGGPSDREAEFPATPLALQGPYDPFTAGQPGSEQNTSGGKKTRTKPIRNAEGVLIRKDGRPDMRSVSSANNLRKVHAKKEAEKAEQEGRTPTSARSLAPAHSNSLSGDEDGMDDSPGSPAEGEEADGDMNDTQERHKEFMSRMFPRGVDSEARNAAERFFPRHDNQDAVHAPEAVMKQEPEIEDHVVDERAGEAGQKDTGSQMTDVVMREMSEAQAEDHAQRQDGHDATMPTVQEGSEEQERDR